jgi:hypothetical protein
MQKKPKIAKGMELSAWWKSGLSYIWEEEINCIKEKHIMSTCLKLSGHKKNKYLFLNMESDTDS